MNARCESKLGFLVIGYQLWKVIIGYNERIKMLEYQWNNRYEFDMWYTSYDRHIRCIYFKVKDSYNKKPVNLLTCASYVVKARMC